MTRACMIRVSSECGVLLRGGGGGRRRRRRRAAGGALLRSATRPTLFPCPPPFQCPLYALQDDNFGQKL